MMYFKMLLVLLISYLSVSLASDAVPVLMFGSGISNVNQRVSGLQRMSSDDFSDYILKKAIEDKPTILLFSEENLSVEDFSWRDEDDNVAFPLLQNMTGQSEFISFLPAVEDAEQGLRKLVEGHYSWQIYKEDADNSEDGPVIKIVKLHEAELMEDRPDMLRVHDKQISEVYNKELEKSSKIMAIFTGVHSSWFDGSENRVKRELLPQAGFDGSPFEIRAQNSNATYLMYVKGQITHEDGTEVKNITKVTTATLQGSNLDLGLLSGSDKYNWDLIFEAGAGTTWALKSIKDENNPDDDYTSVEPIWAPAGYSWFCSRDVKFVNSKNQVITFSYLQIQPFANQKFGRAVDCNPWFTPAIWAGIFIVFILAIVTGWGILMIMDINTNDRFDDPKGKTITISSVE